MTTESVAQSVSNLALSFGDDDADPGAMSRPFGVALLLAGCDDDKVTGNEELDFLTFVLMLCDSSVKLVLDLVPLSHRAPNCGTWIPPERTFNMTPKPSDLLAKEPNRHSRCV